MAKLSPPFSIEKQKKKAGPPFSEILDPPLLSTLVQLLHYILKCNHFGMTTGFFLELLSSLIRNYFPKRTSGAPLYTLSKLYDAPVVFVSPPLFWGSVLLYLRSPRGGCCSLSDDLSCYYHPNWKIARTVSINLNFHFIQSLLLFPLSSTEWNTIALLPSKNAFLHTRADGQLTIECFQQV